MTHGSRTKHVHPRPIAAPPLFELSDGLRTAEAVLSRVRWARWISEAAVLTRAGEREPRGGVMKPFTFSGPRAIALRAHVRGRGCSELVVCAFKTLDPKALVRFTRSLVSDVGGRCVLPLLRVSLLFRRV